MNFKDFIKSEGLKKLATAQLKASSYSILIYLFNEILSGAQEIISSKKELSILLGWSEKQISDGMKELQFYNMVHVVEVVGKPMRIRAQLNTEAWNGVPQFNHDTKRVLGDAFNLHSLHPNQGNSNTPKENFKLTDLSFFDEPIPFPTRPEKHGDHLDEDFSNNDEVKPDDLGAYREKHEIIDAKIKVLAINELENIKKEKRSISADEELLLQILSQHHQPKKQLVMALKANLIYPNLKDFLNTARILADIPK